MKIYFYALAATLLLASCNKEGETVYTTSVLNKALVSVEIIPFVGGKPVTDKIIKLRTGENITVRKRPERGITNNSGFYSDYYSGAEYISVVFNGSDSVFHYTKQDGSEYPNRKKFYLYTSNRNLFNMNSYDYSYEDISSSKREANYIYTFISTDYDFSKP